MMHSQIEEQEIVERYARNQLLPEEQRAFEEHFFACDECFRQVQAAQRLIAGMRDAGRRGLLDGDRLKATPLMAASPWAGWRRWAIPAFAFSSCAALALVALTAWLFLYRLPHLRRQIEQASQQRLQQTVAELRVQEQARAALERQLGRGNAPEGNVPFALLQATREAASPPTEVSVPAGAHRVVLWVEVGGARRFGSFRLQLFTAEDRLVETVENLNRNTYGALVVSLVGERLQPGKYLIKVAGEEPKPSTLVGEYQLRIRRP
jgi:hypothetical protein